MLDMRFFENPRFSAASGAITLAFLALFGTLFLLTQYLQPVLGYSTVKAGAVLLPQAIVLMIFAPLSTVWVHTVRQQGRRRHRALSIVAVSLVGSWRRSRPTAAGYLVIVVTA